MPTESLLLTTIIPAAADRIYRAWLDSQEHSRMTGSPAKVHPHVGGMFSAWDDYISGTTLELEPGRRIVQAWRSTEFPHLHLDSRLELHFRPVPGGTEVTLIHTDIPEGQAAQYHHGWQEFYLTPMGKYFDGSAAKPSKKAAPKKKTAPKKAAPKKKTAPKKKAAKKAAPKKTAPKRKAAPKKGAAKKAAPKKKTAAKKAAPKKKTAKKAKRRSSRK